MHDEFDNKDKDTRLILTNSYENAHRMLEIVKSRRDQRSHNLSFIQSLFRNSLAISSVTKISRREAIFLHNIDRCKQLRFMWELKIRIKITISNYPEVGDVSESECKWPVFSRKFKEDNFPA